MRLINLRNIHANTRSKCVEIRLEYRKLVELNMTRFDGIKKAKKKFDQTVTTTEVVSTKTRDTKIDEQVDDFSKGF